MQTANGLMSNQQALRHFECTRTQPQLSLQPTWHYRRAYHGLPQAYTAMRLAPEQAQTSQHEPAFYNLQPRSLEQHNASLGTGKQLRRAMDAHASNLELKWKIKGFMRSASIFHNFLTSNIF